MTIMLIALLKDKGFILFEELLKTRFKILLKNETNHL